MMATRRQSVVFLALILGTFLPAFAVYGWGQCVWVRVPNSHQAGPDWCPNGWVLTALDLDGCGYGDMHAMGDCPIIAQAKCCQITRGDIAALTDRESDYVAMDKDVVETEVVVTGDILLQKYDVNLWRIFEDEEGIYAEHLKTKKTYRIGLEDMSQGEE